MLRKPTHFIFYLSTLQRPAARAGFCNVLKYKADTFHLSTIQKPAPERKSRPQFKVSQMRNRATRSGTVPTRYTERRSESCSPKRNLTIEGFLRKGKRPPSVTPPKENGSSKPKMAAKAAEGSERPSRTASKSRAEFTRTTIIYV